MIKITNKLKIGIKKNRKKQKIAKINIGSKEILNKLGVGICLIDKNMRIQWMNAQHEKWFGPLKENLNKHCYQAFHGRLKVCRRCPIIKTLKDGKTHKSSLKIIAKNKEKKYYLLTAAPIRNKKDKIIYAFELVQDITQKKKEERNQKQIVNKYRKMCQYLKEANKKLKISVNSLKKSNQHTNKLNNFLKELKEQYKAKVAELRFAKEEIKDIYQVNKSFSTSTDLKQTLNIIVHFSKKITGANAACLRLINPLNKGILFSDASNGLSKRFLENTPLKIGEGVSGIVAATKEPLIIHNIKDDPRVKYTKLAKKEGICSTISVPVIFKNEILGVISVYFKYPKEPKKEEVNLLTTFAAQAALAIQETRLYQDVHINYFNTIHTLVLAMEARDPYTKRHSERVTQYSIKIAKSLKLSNKLIETLTYASKVHDVGKIAISDTVLNKPGKLTIAERALIELHPVKGAEMLTPLSFLRKGIPCVRHHHERFDGNGYPDGIKKEEIPITARIVACADSFDAMTSDRPYRYRKLTIKEAISELERNIGKQFDPQIVPVFVKIIKQS